MTINHSFKARAHLLKLLGDELIGDDRLAVFELIKNAYDADATQVEVTLNLKGKSSSIVIADNGYGMSHKTIENKWLEVGTDSKRGKNRIRTKKFKRMPLGEKGIGRLAVHKLGRKLKLNTRSAKKPECEIKINWPELIDAAVYLDETSVSLKKLSSPKYFNENDTGTRVEITGLYNTNWSKLQLRNLKRLISSLISPFKEVSSFDVELNVPGREDDLSDILEIGDILNRALWTYDFEIDETGSFDWEYKFTPPSTFKSIKKNHVEKDNDKLELTKGITLPRDKKNKDKLFLNKIDLEGIGPIWGELYVFFRRREILNAQGSFMQVRKYLDEQTGVRVYRDDVRVFNYGEEGDDWLGLNLERINRPSERIGTKSIIAAISLDLEKSVDLIEKTNREGFDENHTFQRFRGIVQSVMEHFRILHKEDRGIIVTYLKDGTAAKKADPVIKFTDTINGIRTSLKKHGLEKELKGKIDTIETEYLKMRDVTMTSGIAGINLAVIFHEVEREIKALHSALKNKEALEKLIDRSEHLTKLIEGFTPLLKNKAKKNFSIKLLINKAVSLIEHRFKYHNIILSAPVLTGEDSDFEINGPFGLLQASINNIIDNSIHWCRWEKEKSKKPHKGAIGIFTLINFFNEGPAIAIADNGPGFSITPEEAVSPFVTTRPGGMGLGLYYANLVMETIGGRLMIMSPDDLDLPKAYNGAAVVLLFKKGKI